MAAEALASFFARSSAAIILDIYVEQIREPLDSEFQLHTPP